MITRASVEREYNIVNGIIQNPGKFEGEPAYVPYYWDLAMDGCADEVGEVLVFHLDASDVAIWPELASVASIHLAADSNGFVSHTCVPPAVKAAGGFSVIEALTVLALICCIAMIVFSVWYEYKHPCTRHETRTCTSLECTGYVPTYDSDGDLTGMSCAAYENRSYPCQICVERGAEKNE